MDITDVHLERNAGEYLNIDASDLPSCGYNVFFGRIKVNGIMTIRVPDFAMRTLLEDIEKIERDAGLVIAPFSEKAIAAVTAVEQFLQQQGARGVFMPHCVKGWTSVPQISNLFRSSDRMALRASRLFFQEHLELLQDWSKAMRSRRSVWGQAIEQSCSLALKEPLEKGCANKLTEPQKWVVPKALMPLHQLLQHDADSVYRVDSLEAKIGQRRYDSNTKSPLYAKEGNIWHFLCSTESGIRGIQQLLQAQEQTQSLPLNHPIPFYALWIEEKGGFLDHKKCAKPIAVARLFPSINAAQRMCNTLREKEGIQSIAIVKGVVEGLLDQVTLYQDAIPMFAQWKSANQRSVLQQALSTKTKATDGESNQQPHHENACDQEQQYPTVQAQMASITVRVKEDAVGASYLTYKGDNSNIVTQLWAAHKSKKPLLTNVVSTENTKDVALNLQFTPVAIEQWLGAEGKSPTTQALLRSCAHHDTRILQQYPILQEMQTLRRTQEEPVNTKSNPSRQRPRL